MNIKEREYLPCVDQHEVIGHVTCIAETELHDLMSRRGTYMVTGPPVNTHLV
jgi:hypothetical protein